ncbi:7088_t:CDS:2, partial [Scutellospora calospora]
EIKAESQLGKGSKFWFTWNVALLDTQFYERMSDKLSNIKQKRILIIHPVEGARNAMLKFLKKAKKVDAFSTFDEVIKAAKAYREWSEQSAYDIVFIRLYENNEEETMKLSKKVINNIGGITSVIYTPITWKKLINLCIL